LLSSSGKRGRSPTKDPSSGHHTPASTPVIVTPGTYGSVTSMTSLDAKAQSDGYSRLAE